MTYSCCFALNFQRLAFTSWKGGGSVMILKHLGLQDSIYIYVTSTYRWRAHFYWIFSISMHFTLPYLAWLCCSLTFPLSPVSCKRNSWTSLSPSLLDIYTNIFNHCLLKAGRETVHIIPFLFLECCGSHNSSSQQNTLVKTVWDILYQNGILYQNQLRG